MRERGPEQIDRPGRFSGELGQSRIQAELPSRLGPADKFRARPNQGERPGQSVKFRARPSQEARPGQSRR